ncbi:MAG: ribokinase [Pseudomonadota bacterium]
MADVVVLGIFAVDLAFEAPRLPAVGETLLGEGFRMGPGGKGSNQAIAAAKAGARTAFLTRIGQDAFADIALKTWNDAGVGTSAIIRDEGRATGAAFIFVSTETGDNAVIVESGAAGAISADDADDWTPLIGASKVFVTQLEQPQDAARRALQIAKVAGVTTIMNPAPAATLDDALLASCDFLTPNEAEAAGLTGRTVNTVDDARTAAETLRGRGVGTVIVTLGAEGALIHGEGISERVPAFHAGPVRDTTGAGDAFNGAFACALAEGRSPRDAVRFGCAAASLSVTRPGAAAASATRAEIDAFLSSDTSKDP